MSAMPNKTQSNETKSATKLEVAAHFQVTPRTIDQWMRTGLIPYWKIGHTVRFDLIAVTAMLNEKALKNGGKK